MSRNYQESWDFREQTIRDFEADDLRRARLEQRQSATIMLPQLNLNNESKLKFVFKMLFEGIVFSVATVSLCACLYVLSI